MQPLLTKANQDRGEVGRKWLFDIFLSAMMFVATVLLILMSVRSLRSIPDAPTYKAASVPSQPLSIRNSASKGSVESKVVLVIYSDFQCPFCARFARDVLPEIEQAYVATGAVALVFKHLPLESIHPLSVGAAEAAECAGAQGRFWQRHDRLFEEPLSLGAPAYAAYATEIGLNIAGFNQCLDGGMIQRVRSDMADAMKLGLDGTPVTFIARRLAGDEVLVDEQLRGLPSFQALSEAIDRVLAKKI
jgi:protein-disulfide isomerase